MKDYLIIFGGVFEMVRVMYIIDDKVFYDNLDFMRKELYFYF